MATPGSNKNSPVHVRYFQTLADTIGIFWQFHKERVQEGNMVFAYSSELRDFSPEFGFVMRPYDPQEIAEVRYRNRGLEPQRVIWDFAEGVGRSLQGSWNQFLEGNNTRGNNASVRHVAVPEKSKRFFDPFVEEKLREAQKLGTTASRFGGNNFDVSFPLSEGAGTGAQAVTQVTGLFYDTFRPSTITALARIKGQHQTRAAQEIGTIYSFDNGLKPELIYSLLDDSPLGVDRSRLEAWGYGDTLGCPAAMRISPEANTFLASRNASPGGRTMLRDFSEMVYNEFDTTVGTWVKGLTPEEQQRYIDQEQLAIITGETRRAALEQRACMDVHIVKNDRRQGRIITRIPDKYSPIGPQIYLLGTYLYILYYPL